MPLIRLATRRSPLALVQARRVACLLESAREGLETALVEVESGGDRLANVPISEIGGEGVFVVEVDRAVRTGEADIAVHSAKDLPSRLEDDGLLLASVPERADPRDALVGRQLSELAPGALVATGAARRRAQLAWARPDLGFAELRGNIATRLSKIPPGGAVVVAAAALVRLALEDRAAELLSTELMLPQVGQGALALRCRIDDANARQLCESINDRRLFAAVSAERAFLATLGGGCDAPIGAYATCSGEDESLELSAFIAREDGHAIVRGRLVGCAPESLGAALAVHLLEASGGESLLSGGVGR
jgi:hydroxymethylbilane synthase